MGETTYQVVQDFFQQQYQQKFAEETIGRSDLYIPSLPIIRPSHALPTLSTLPYLYISSISIPYTKSKKPQRITSCNSPKSGTNGTSSPRNSTGAVKYITGAHASKVHRPHSYSSHWVDLFGWDPRSRFFMIFRQLIAWSAILKWAPKNTSVCAPNRYPVRCGV